LSNSAKPFWCQHRDGYSVISFPKNMATAHMAEIREAGLKVLDHLQTMKSPSCLVDLSALDYMGSSLVASIVRIWKAVKEKNGQMVVVTSSDRIHEVLKTTGLTKVWTITSTFESGVHALGFSPEAKVEKRELRLLEFVGPMAVVGSCLLVAAKIFPQIPLPFPIPNWVVYTALGLALLTSGVAMFRERGIQRVLSTLGFILAVPVLSFFIWRSEFQVPVPARLPQALIPAASVTPVPQIDNVSDTKELDAAAIVSESPETENETVEPPASNDGEEKAPE
jgi:anti-anti-sigma factor